MPSSLLYEFILELNVGLYITQATKDCSEFLLFFLADSKSKAFIWSSEKKIGEKEFDLNAQGFIVA